MIDEMVKIIRNSENLVFFTGAGISTESDIPDFRSENGLFRSVKNYGYPPEKILSHSFLMTNTELFYRYYHDNLIYLEAKPNAAHLCIRELETIGFNVTVITQNIDGLHQLAKSSHVLELHGSVYRNYCMTCNKQYSIHEIVRLKPVPICPGCHGLIRPDVTLYEENLKSDIIYSAVDKIRKADVLFVIGTSLLVYPANSLPGYLENDNLIIINKEKTAYDSHAKYVFHDSCGRILSNMVNLLKGTDEYT